MIIFRLGWRNLWRNTRRSLITLAGIAFAFALLIALVGFAKGLITQMLRNGADLLVGHIQIHDSSYLPDRSLYDTIGGAPGSDWPKLLTDLRRQPDVRSVAPRVYGFGLVSTGDKSSGAEIIGIDPQAEQGLSRAISRDALARLSEPHAIVIGELLALELGAREGDEVAIVAQAADGTLGNDLFRVRAVIRTGLAYLDRSLTLARLEDVQQLLALAPNRIHEIAIRIDDPMKASAVAVRLRHLSDLPAHSAVESWRELLPQLSAYVDVAGGANAFIIGLVVLFASIGVLNTMMMATFERFREVGMLSAIGMRPRLITATFLAESFILALLGLAAGLALGAVIMRLLITHGLDLSRWTGELSMVGTKLDPVVKGAWDWTAVKWAGVSLCIATVVAAYLPARRAAHVNPVEALHAPVMT
jgi:ABC-type lipoprotein release transport system permease subunit